MIPAANTIIGRTTDHGNIGKAFGVATSISTLGFAVGPRINAAGRIGHPQEEAELFLTADPGRARRLAGHLQNLNSERQELELLVPAADTGDASTRERHRSHQFAGDRPA